MKNKWPNGLAQAMKAKDNIGPTALAKKVGTSKQNIQRWRDGERELPRDWAVRIAPALDVTAADLLLLNDEAVTEPSPRLAEVLQLSAQLEPSEVASLLAALDEKRAASTRSKSNVVPKVTPATNEKSNRRTHS